MFVAFSGGFALLMENRNPRKTARKTSHCPVKQFIQNWFVASGLSDTETAQQWELIQQTMSNQPDLREMTATPVLLSLICVVWQDSGALPTNRNHLYKKGVNWLLRRWNEEKEIEGWELGAEAYRQLSVDDKEALLIEIAARKFESPKNFVLFEQQELAKQISHKLGLTSTQKGVFVLKAIEAQHGLLIERADELWSFSHLTFQEYFTVQWLIRLPPQQLAEKMDNQQWQNAVIQLVKSQQPADRLIRLIKQAADQLVAQISVVQTFFSWLFTRPNAVQTNYKPEAIRAFYYSLTCAQSLDLNRTLDHSLDRTLSLDIAHTLNCVRARSLGNACILDRPLAFDLALDLALSRPLAYALDCGRETVCARQRVNDLNRSLEFALSLALDFDHSLSLIPHLRQLKTALPISTHSNEIQCWWVLNGAQWIKQLRQDMIEHRDIGHNWQFTQKQQIQLKRYYRVNKFLADLVKIEGAASKKCRTEIEEGLLLPWAELQRCQPHLYGERKEDPTHHNLNLIPIKFV